MFSTELSSISSKRPNKQNKNEDKRGEGTHTHPFVHMQVGTRRAFTGNERRLEVTHTGSAGAWHAHLRDGGENGVVHAALANQVDDPVRQLFDGAPVQLVVLSRLQKRRRKPT